MNCNSNIIFDIDIDFSDYSSLLGKIFSKDTRTITCVNQYYLNIIMNDNEYKSLVQKFDLIHPDGIGVVIAKKILCGLKRKVTKVTGSDLYFMILEKMNVRRNSLFLLGDSEEVVKLAKSKINMFYPNISVNGFHHGYIDLADNVIIEEINATKPDFLFVGLGVKRQEYWIDKWKKDLNAKKIIAMGGGLRVVAGDRPRGSKVLQNLGFEWFIRLITEPKKMWKRYLIGIPLFIFRVIKYKVSLRNSL
jgi:N-acetylglucosaminyldiphosphoundecaprenol N-acetyl-beta-D-mannosaminyltransferase